MISSETFTIVFLALLALVGLVGLIMVARGYRAVVREARALERSRAHLWTAIVLGALGATLATSVAVFVLRVLILWFAAFTLGAVFLLPFFTAVWFARAMVRWARLPALRPQPLVAAAVIGFPAAAAGPWGPSWIVSRIDAQRTVPPLPGARGRRIAVTFGDGENHGDFVTLTFPATADRDSVLAFYRAGYAERGFEELPPDASSNPATIFCSDQRTIALRFGDAAADGAVPYTATVDRMGCPPLQAHALVTGHVRTAQGPVPGVRVVVHCGGPGRSFGEGGTTDSAGAFRIAVASVHPFARHRAEQVFVPCEVRASMGSRGTAPDAVAHDSVVFVRDVTRRQETVVELQLP